MPKINILFIGMDTHKEFCQIAYCEDSREHKLDSHHKPVAV